MADDDSRAGVTYFSREILDWCASRHAPDTEALKAAQDAASTHGMPTIQLGPSEGKLIAMLLRLNGAKRVVEIGTLAGYSALHMVEALPPDGKIWSVEDDAHHADVARSVIARAGHSLRIEVLHGEALEVLPKLEQFGPFCAVFVDADKENYDAYGRWAARNVRPGGLLIGDNAFLFGELLGDSARAEVMRTFHEEARNAFDTTCIPTPDGLLVGIRR
jgi:caffeoyl-CoA O-methyltransferase